MATMFSKMPYKKDIDTLLPNLEVKCVETNLATYRRYLLT